MEHLNTFKVSHLSKIYHKQVVIKDFSYEFQSGLYLFTGENGSGKSTVIKMIAKVINPSGTDYYMDKRKIAYLCERVELEEEKPYPFLKWIQKLSHNKENIKEMMKKWSIPNKNMMRLSKGNRQKVAILMMRLTDSDVYLLDEPTDALDQEHIQLLVEVIEYWLELGKIVIIATHEKSYFEGVGYHEVQFS